MMLEFDWTVSLGLLVVLGSYFFTWLRTRRQDVDDRLSGIDERFHTGSKRMDELELRVQAAEQTIATLPGKDDLHNLQIEMVRQTGQLAEIKATMSGNGEIMSRLEQIVSRHEEHLLSGSKS